MTCSEGFVRVPGPVLRVLGTDTSCVGDWTLSKPSTLPIMFRAGVPCCVCSQEALPSQHPSRTAAVRSHSLPWNCLASNRNTPWWLRRAQH